MMQELEFPMYTDFTEQEKNKRINYLMEREKKAWKYFNDFMDKAEKRQKERQLKTNTLESNIDKNSVSRSNTKDALEKVDESDPMSIKAEIERLESILSNMKPEEERSVCREKIDNILCGKHGEKLLSEIESCMPSARKRCDELLSDNKGYKPHESKRWDGLPDSYGSMSFSESARKTWDAYKNDDPDEWLRLHPQCKDDVHLRMWKKGKKVNSIYEENEAIVEEMHLLEQEKNPLKKTFFEKLSDLFN